MIPRVRDPWPFPADTPLERARRIARLYREALLNADLDLCHHLDAQSEHLGEGWIRPLETDIADLDETFTAAELVAKLHIPVKPATIRRWGARGHIERLGPPGAPYYRIRDVLAYEATRRAKRHGLQV